MVTYENECVDCGLPCIGDACRYKNVPHYHCDDCDEAELQLYEWDSHELCIDCIEKRLSKVN